MEFAKVTVEFRKDTGKGGSHRTRAAGRVPGILYGHKQDPVPIAFDERTLVKSLDKEKRRNTVFSLSINGGGSAEAVTAMIRDAQIDPISQHLIHVDFLRVDPDEEVRVSVPIALVGKAVGVVNGGNLHQSIHDMLIASKPAAIPTRIEVDVTALDIGDALHVSDVKLPPGVRSLLEGKEAVASIVIPREEKTETPVAEAATAEAGAAGAAATPAEGAAAAGAAPGGAAAGKKEPEKKEKK